MNSTTLLIEILDNFLSSMQDDCTRTDTNMELVNWEYGVIFGLLTAGRITNALDHESTFFIQDIADGWKYHVTGKIL